MNKIQLIGRWTKDIELKFLPGNGTANATGILAVDRRFKNENQPTADFLPVVFWKKQAEAVANYCGQKGDMIGITGRIQTRNYKNKDGVTIYITEIVAEEVDFLNFKKKENDNSSSENASNDEIYDEDLTPMDDGDMPF